MANEATEQVARYFDSDGVRPHIEELCETWNASELLGIDLADQLRDFLREQAAKADIDASLDEVDWNYLAEHYASSICGIDEEELTRRRTKYENNN